jgi:hypothetical protein
MWFPTSHPSHSFDPLSLLTYLARTDLPDSCNLPSRVIEVIEIAETKLMSTLGDVELESNE